MAMTRAAYEEKKKRLIDFLKEQDGGEVRLNKNTSNLFRDRKNVKARRLDVRDFNNVLYVDKNDLYVEVEGMTPYEKLVHECLQQGVMPTVVPELKSITIGGAVTGVGIESSSFKYGLVHETVQEMEILRGDGTIVVCTPDNEYRDLFYGFPNSYGTLGYALKLKVKVVPVKPFVKLTHIRHNDTDAFFDAVSQWCSRDVDFIDGTVFAKDELYLTVGQFVDQAPYSSDYTYTNVYYLSIRERDTDYLAVEDYIWRWDTDWFWCSKNVFAQNPLVRRLLGRSRLNSVTYTKIMRWNSEWNLTGTINKLLGIHSESVIQDVEIPLGRCRQFLDFYFDTIRFTPVWICPVRAYDKNVRFDLYPLDPDTLYVNFGFWDVIKGRKQYPAGYYNRQIEEKVAELGGMKSLYSDSYYSEEQFWKLYDKSTYDRLKQKYDPKQQLKNIFAKCVQKE
jgi:FAD/FMN-containing dehydrogenase